MQSQGGTINVAELITRVGSPSFGQTLRTWLEQIPRKPKAFKVKMRPINELLNINVKSIFMNYGTEICQKTDVRKCHFGTTLNEFQESFDKRRKSLEFAIELFRHKVSRFIKNS